jgi:CD109 antigen
MSLSDTGEESASMQSGDGGVSRRLSDRRSSPNDSGGEGGGSLASQPVFSLEDSSSSKLGGLDVSDFDMEPPSLDQGDDGSGYMDIGDTNDPTGGLAMVVQTRQYFPETWYWNPWLITDEEGFASLALTTPDSITSWNIEAVATTKDARFGMGTEEVTVFKGFFIEPDMPVSVVRNDEFPLKILIYNYEDESSNITVSLHPGGWYELLSESTEQWINVNASSVSSIEFRIKAKDVGRFLVTVEGDNGAKIDKVIREMTVEPDGKPFVDLINGALEDDQIVNTKIDILQNRVPNSENAYVKLQGGIEAVTLDGAENFIQFVSGCGEQSTSRLAVDIAAYKNLLKGDLTDEKMFEFENILNQGIQHEMMYVIDNRDGTGKSVVWHGTGPPDLWLTAWATFVFQDLVDVGFNVDEDIIEGFQKYLVSTQNNDGSYEFEDVGHWSINSKLQNQKLTSTAYITRALLYSGYSKESTEVKKSIDYIQNKVSANGDAYTIALSLLALEMGSGSKTIRDQLAGALISQQQTNVEEGTAWWSWTSGSSGSDNYYNDGNTIETTSYAIMALNKKGAYGSAVNKAVKYLLTHRSGGCFRSTHDTAVAFQALNTIDEFNIEDLLITVYEDDEEVNSIRFNDENKDITYLIDLRPYLDSDGLNVKLVSSGKGSIFYQIFCEQYLPWSEANLFRPPELTLDVKYDTTNIKVNDMIQAEVNLMYNGGSPQLKMVLLDLRAPVGFAFVESDFQDLLEGGVINYYEHRGRQALVYVDDLVKGELITFYYSLLALKPIKGTIQGVNAFDMYNTEITTELGPIEVQSTM